MKFLIPVLIAFMFRMGGKGYGDTFVPKWEWSRTWPKWFHDKLWRRIGIGIAISAITGNIWYLPGYMIALWVFCYGDTSCWVRKYTWKHITWFIFGFAFGIASWSAWNGVFSGLVFMSLMHLSNEGNAINSSPGANDWLVSGKYWLLDHSYVEVGIGFFATIIFALR